MPRSHARRPSSRWYWEEENLLAPRSSRFASSRGAGAGGGPAQRADPPRMRAVRDRASGAARRPPSSAEALPAATSRRFLEALGKRERRRTGARRRRGVGGATRRSRGSSDAARRGRFDLVVTSPAVPPRGTNATDTVRQPHGDRGVIKRRNHQGIEESDRERRGAISAETPRLEPKRRADSSSGPMRAVRSARETP